MEKLETLIQELYQEGTREKNMEVLSQIRKLAKEEKQFIIPVGDANGEKVYRRLSLDDGQDVFVAFTTQNQVFYPQLGVKLCSMAGGGVQKIYMVFFKRTVPAGQVRQ